MIGLDYKVSSHDRKINRKPGLLSRLVGLLYLYGERNELPETLLLENIMARTSRTSRAATETVAVVEKDYSAFLNLPETARTSVVIYSSLLNDFEGETIVDDKFIGRLYYALRDARPGSKIPRIGVPNSYLKTDAFRVARGFYRFPAVPVDRREAFPEVIALGKELAKRLREETTVDRLSPTA